MLFLTIFFYNRLIGQFYNTHLREMDLMEVLGGGGGWEGKTLEIGEG